MKTFQEFLETHLDENVEIDHSTFMGSHGKKARGTGSWIVSKHKHHDAANHKEGVDYHQASGSLSTVARDAAKKLKTQRVYVQP